MKKFNLLSFLLLFTVALVLPSCSDDDDDDGSSSSSFVFDGNTIEVENGFIANIGPNGEINGTETFDFDVFLTDENISAGGTFGITGTGDFITLDLNTNSSMGLVAGTYNFSSSREAFSIVDGVVRTEFNTTTNSGTLSGITLSANAGSVEVDINGSEVTLTVDLDLSDGSTLTGSYQGELEGI